MENLKAKGEEKEGKSALDKSLIKKQMLLINEKHKEDTRVLHQDCFSYNSVFTSKVGDLLLYVQNNESTSAPFWE